MIFAPGKNSLLKYARHLIYLNVAPLQTTRKIKCMKQQKNAKIPLL